MLHLNQLDTIIKNLKKGVYNSAIRVNFAARSKNGKFNYSQKW